MHSFIFQDVRSFMNTLLCTEAFDHFGTVSISVRTFCTFSADGALLKDYFDTDEELPAASGYVRWKQLRPFVFSLIRGKKKPLSLQIVLKADVDAVSSFQQNQHDTDTSQITGYFLNLRYQHEQTPDSLLCTTGVSRSGFSMDKSEELLWDEYCETFFRSLGLTAT